jgi:phage repressor protein C with HTH and peptisase S24 domain
MRHGKGKDKSVVHYNDLITVRGIPIEAYDYVVNGKSAIEWVMERQSVTTDKASGIVKDANDWATETVGDPRYPLSLLLRVITVSLETLRIVRALPALDILEEADASAPSPEPAAAEGQLLPFRRVTPKPAERYRTAVPLIDLAMAAGGWSESQEAIVEPHDPSVAWVTFDASHKLTKGMFVARVVGRSMEPLIADGAYCLFREVKLPSSPDRPVLVRHGGQADPETGGQYTIKFYRVEKATNGARRLALAPQNPAFATLTLGPREAKAVRVIAEVVRVLFGGDRG